MAKIYDDNWCREVTKKRLRKLIKDFPHSVYFKDRKRMLKSLAGDGNGKNKTTKKIEKS